MKQTVFAITACAASLAFGGDLIQWTDTSATALFGSGFEVDPEDQTTLTIEHANGWKYGDFFWFNDFIYFNGDDITVDGSEESWSYYGEISPRFSLNKITGSDLSVAFIKDWLIATCYEYGRNVNLDKFGDNYLVGAGVDLDIPGFDFFQLNVYQRFAGAGDGDTVQITPVWKMSFPVGESQIIFDGFIDWVVNSDGAYEKNLHVCPQIKLDIGAFFGLDAGALLAGTELDYWTNKYGVDDAENAFVDEADQFAASGIVQYHF